MAIGPDGSVFTAIVTDRATGEQRRLEALTLPMYGRHNVQNALAAVAVAAEMGIDDALIRDTLRHFAGVKRRFTKTGVSHGITVIDDYGHHPVEISAVLSAARSAAGGGNVVAVVQPHRYSRLNHLFDEFCGCFNDADAVIVADVYAAGEERIEGADRDALIAGLRARGHKAVHALKDRVELAGLVADVAKSGDYVVCLGAGSITAWANALPGELDHILDAKPKSVGAAVPGMENTEPEDPGAKVVRLDREEAR